MRPRQTSAVLDHNRLDELVRVIGPSKLETALAEFKHNLDSILSATDTDDIQIDEILMLAHRTTPAASVLGFQALSDASRMVLDRAPRSDATLGFSDAVANLAQATRQAAAILKTIRG